MEKENLQLYVNLMNKYEEQAKMGITMVFTSDDKNLMSYMKKMALKDAELNEFLNTLTDMSPNERYDAIEKRFSKNKEGLVITLDEIKDYKEVIDEKSKEEKNKLNYIINNYKLLNVKGIRLDDMKYIDENDEIHDVDLDDKIIPFKSKKVEKESIDEIDVPLRSSRYHDEVEEQIVDEEDEIKPEPIKSKETKETKKSGFVSAIMLFLFTGFAGGVLATILLLILKK